MNSSERTNEFSKGRSSFLTVKSRVFSWIKLLFIPSVAKRSFSNVDLGKSKVISFPTPERMKVVESKQSIILKELEGLNLNEISFLFRFIQYEVDSKSIFSVKE